MIREKQLEKSEKLRKLHHKDKIFLMPYAWNGGSARIFEKEGFEAVCTTSAGIAYSMGYSDGEVISFEDVIRVTKEMVSVVDIPVSVDIELGYGDTLVEIKENVRRLVLAGAVGVNIEDGYAKETPSIEDLETQLEKIKTLRELREEMNIPFFINARTCVYWLEIGDSDFRLEEAIKRGNLFLKAGGDCVFIPGKIDIKTARILVEKIDGPVNLIVNPVTDNIDELEKAGVRRLCMGSGSVRCAFEKVQETAKEFRGKDINKMLTTGFSYKKANEYFNKN